MTTMMDGHIVVDDRNVARIAGSRTKVIHLVMEQQANGWSVDQLKEQFPHLNVAAIYAAMAYYHDRREQVDSQIDESLEIAIREHAEAEETPFHKRLREAAASVSVRL